MFNFEDFPLFNFAEFRLILRNSMLFGLFTEFRIQELTVIFGLHLSSFTPSLQP
jgi:hypothetical protein